MKILYLIPVCVIAIVVGLIMGTGNIAWALPIDPGFDLLSTPPGGGIIPAQGNLPPIPMKGVPIDPVVLGNTDTIVQRMSSLPDGGTGQIQAEIVALNLMSVNPLQVGDSFFDVFVTLDRSHTSTGTIDITTHDDQTGGGTFDSFFDVFTKITLVDPATGLAVIDPIFRYDSISSSDTPWSHTCAPGLLCLAEGTLFDIPTGDPPFHSGNFFITPAGINHTGPHPHVDPSQPIPEPSALLLLASGLAGVAIFARKFSI